MVVLSTVYVEQHFQMYIEAITDICNHLSIIQLHLHIHQNSLQLLIGHLGDKIQMSTLFYHYH
jgi:hypothetical protein